MSELSKFFSRIYGISVQEYENMIGRYSTGDGLFTDLYGHVYGHGGDPISGETLKEQGIEHEENKLYGEVDIENKIVTYKDKVNDYFLNSNRFRSDHDYDGSEELIYIGCSHTFGEGVPEKTIWGSVVAKDLGMSYANIARAGMSPYWCVDNVFGYLEKYKAKPKIILALMPDFIRIQTVTNPLLSVSYQGGYDKKESIKQGVYIANQWLWGRLESIPKYLEKPFESEYSMTRESAFMYNLRAIHSLEAYCKAAGITFLWSTWSPDEANLFKAMKEATGMPENYVDIETSHWHATDEDGYRDIYHKAPGNFGDTWSRYGDCDNKKLCSGVFCHQHLEEEYKENFYRGTDSENAPEHSHFGVHRHAHFAENFLKAIKDRLK